MARKRLFWILLSVFALILSGIGGICWWIHWEDESVLLLVVAEEVDSGEAYELLVGVANQCGTTMPRLYTAQRLPFNAAYLSGSTFPLGFRHGKVIISQEYLDFLDRNALRGVFAHEIVHKQSDPGTHPFRLMPEPLSVRIQTDLRAADCVGIEPVYAMLHAFEHMSVPSWVEDPRHGLSEEQKKILLARDRIEALERLVALENYRRTIRRSP